MTQCRHLPHVRQTSSVVMITRALILVDNVTERTTVQMALMSMTAVNDLL